MIGTTLEHYRIVELIGKGGMGEVYLADDTRLQRQVALKILARELAGDPDQIFNYALSFDQRQIGLVRGHTNSDVVLISTARK